MKPRVPHRRKDPGGLSWQHPSPWLVALAIAGAAACTGSIPDSGGNPSGNEPTGNGNGPDNGRGSSGGSNPGNSGSGGNMETPPAPAPTGVSASAAPLRRLNAEQYKNTVQDLLGAGALVSEANLPPDESIGEDRFISNVRRPVQGADVDRYADAAAAIAEKAVTDLPGLLGCDPSGANEQSCVGDFIASFGKRAYRRPLASEEVESAKALYDVGRTGADPANGVRLVVQAMLQSPSFLYLFEPAPGAAPGSIVALDDWALAARLSYFFLNSMPDQELFAAAEGNKLDNPDEVASQALRLMGTDRFRSMVANFHEQWLELKELGATEKNAELFPAWGEPLRAALMEEPRRFVETVMAEGNDTLETLLTAKFSVLSGPLYELYGVQKPAGVADDAWTKVELDPTQRAGLFTQAGLMASLASDERTSFIRRGRVIRAGLLCTPIPEPPPGVDSSETDVSPTADARERARVHRDKPECAACHALFDPLGFAFENYDPIGRYRATENGRAIDASTEITETSAVDGPVENAIEMMTRLAGAEEVRACFAKQWLRFALGRDDTKEDATSLAQALEGFEKGEWKVQNLLQAIARSDSFRYQKVNP